MFPTLHELYFRQKMIAQHTIKMIFLSASYDEDKANTLSREASLKGKDQYG
jgi:ABC-type Zn uptake system ZnuABC Zn-binding protein ZnuA